MGFGGWLGFNKKGKSLKPEEVATEQAAQAAVDKLVTGSKEFGNRSISAKDAETQLRAQGLLPKGWRLRESDSTSSGYRPTQAASKKSAAVHAGILAGAGLSGFGLAGIGPLAAASAAGAGGGAAAGAAGGAAGAAGGGLTGAALTSAAIQGGLGAAQGLTEGGGWKGALKGGAFGAAGSLVPGAGGALGKLGSQAALQGGLGAAESLARGGGWKGALRGGAVGAGGAVAPKVAPALTKSALGQKAINYGLNTGLNTAATGKFDAKGAITGAGSSFLPDASAKATGSQFGQNLINYGGTQGLNLATGRFNPTQAGTDAFNTFRPPSGGGNGQGGDVVRGQSTWDKVGAPLATTGAGLAASYLGGNPKATYSGGSNIVAGDDPSGTGGGGGGGGGAWDTYGPLIAQGGGLVAGALAGRKATEMAMARSPEELAALRGATGAAGAQGRYGSQILGAGQTDTTQARNYYSKLLTGNRALQTQAVAPGIASVTDAYRGAARGLDQAGVRGAGRDVANADLARAKASQISGLTTGVQPGAAAALAQMGGQQTATGGQLLGNAGNLYGNLLGQGTLNRKYGREEGEKTSKAIGQLSRDVGEVIGGKGKKPGTPTVKTPGKDWGVYDPSRTPAPRIPATGNPTTGADLPGWTPTTAPPPSSSPLPNYGPGVRPPVFGANPPPSKPISYGGFGDDYRY